MIEYIKVYTDFQDILAPLSDEQAGRLFRAMLHYAETGEEPDFAGVEAILWKVARRDIDVAEKKIRANRQNGGLGGRPKKTEENPTETQPKPKKTQTKPKQNPKEPKENHSETQKNPHTIPYHYR